MLTEKEEDDEEEETRQFTEIVLAGIKGGADEKTIL